MVSILVKIWCCVKMHFEHKHLGLSTTVVNRNKRGWNLTFEVWASQVNIFALNRDKRPSRKTLSNSRIYVTIRFYEAPEIWASPIHSIYPPAGRESTLSLLLWFCISPVCEVKTLDLVAPEMSCDPVNLAAPVFLQCATRWMGFHFKMYLSKLSNVFVWMAKCISLNRKINLSKF